MHVKHIRIKYHFGIMPTNFLPLKMEQLILSILGFNQSVQGLKVIPDSIEMTCTKMIIQYYLGTVMIRFLHERKNCESVIKISSSKSHQFVNFTLWPWCWGCKSSIPCNRYAHKNTTNHHLGTILTQFLPEKAKKWLKFLKNLTIKYQITTSLWNLDFENFLESESYSLK